MRARARFERAVRLVSRPGPVLPKLRRRRRRRRRRNLTGSC